MTRLMDFYDRQRRVPGWRQEPLREARVAVVGRDWVGTYVASGLKSMGIGEVLWFGAPRPWTDGTAAFFLNQEGPSALKGEPYDIEFGPELAWGCAGRMPRYLVCATEDRDAWLNALGWADRNHVEVLGGRASLGGHFGTDPPARASDAPQDPVIALMVAALLVDEVRERLSPLHLGTVTPQGGLGLTPAPPRRPLEVDLVGVGGIGVWAAHALCASCGGQLRLRLWDFDSVGAENLNRQALFTVADAVRRAPKALAARRTLSEVFPHVQVSAEVRKIGADEIEELKTDARRPSVVLSAVDNAETRLMLQRLGRTCRVPVVQAGTGTFLADCFTQVVGGASLDDQTHGAMSAAMVREALGRPAGHCGVDPSYVVPGMMAGAFLAYRATRIGKGGPLSPMRWRQGDRPREVREETAGFDFGDVLSRIARVLSRPLIGAGS
jgi:molybdopterin/thiamine biosynthesis adenylyltransferase